ncbi:uncharacterized protein J8A68_002941 [[Candida] subhashii]|uniref:NEDD8-activating enzyme E1 regulatory subunit n=1 Tax=[Candida] subhashii TaxID=561895 RepID=A0A8J5QNB5_9ASCO|nr:uncharacterized protein J8A68_002941 [[Candida] subhashii]KAG7663555.1 hypothetical protein J8A68_002941 [[Candida] subhashii]
MTNDKETRYDRQLRLWASSGQSKLEDSHVCLINATPTGSETLKNLILPGIGEYTIIDNKLVTSTDLSSNFFLKKPDLNCYLSCAISNNLNELNQEVKGHAITSSIEDILINESESYWEKFNIVIISDYLPSLRKLIEILWSRQIPILIINSIGYYGSLNILTNEITVIETHDPSKLFDLRIDKPWPELQQFADSFDLDKLNDAEHSHVPYIVIFIKALDKWKSLHNGQPPLTYADKKLFKSYIESMSRNIQLETNFMEAANSYHRACQKTEIPDSINALFIKSKERGLANDTPIFWIYIAALENFVTKNNQQLPLAGSLPDMASDTKNYINLQNIYRTKALKDQKLFTEEVHGILESIGRNPTDIPNESIAVFCKNVQLLFVTIGSRKLVDTQLIEKLYQESDDSDEYNTLAIYFAILTFNIFVGQNGRNPTIEDLDSFIKIFGQNFSSRPISLSIANSFKEILAHNTRNYHNLCSLMGGVASQEVLKLTTSQYIPLDNLFVFDGIRSSSERYKIGSLN